MLYRTDYVKILFMRAFSSLLRPKSDLHYTNDITKIIVVMMMMYDDVSCDHTIYDNALLINTIIIIIIIKYKLYIIIIIMT